MSYEGNHSIRRAGASLAVVVAAVVSLGLLASAPALASGPPVGKIYDCYSYNYATGFLNYVQALELKTRSVYLVAPARKGNHLSGRSAAGRYRARGRSITWLSGPYGQIHWKGLFHPATNHPTDGLKHEGAYIELLDRKGDSTGISCYEH